jgi:hypothetical protein
MIALLPEEFVEVEEKEATELEYDVGVSERPMPLGSPASCWSK